MVVMALFKAPTDIGYRTEATDLTCNYFFENRGVIENRGFLRIVCL